MFLSGAIQSIRWLTQSSDLVQKNDSDQVADTSCSQPRVDLASGFQTPESGLSISRVLIEDREVLILKGCDREFSEEKYLACLDMKEIDRLKAINNEPKYQSVVAGRVLTRLALSMVVNGKSKPEDWEFENSDDGKPLIRNNYHKLSFSVTHCDGTTFVAVSDWCEVGIDAEQHIADAEQEFIRDVLSRDEQNTLNSANEEQKPSLLSELWTLKEAYTKLLGTGLAADLQQVAFQLNPPRLEQSAKDISAKFLTWTGWGESRPCQVAIALR